VWVALTYRAPAVRRHPTISFVTEDITEPQASRKHATLLDARDSITGRNNLLTVVQAVARGKTAW